MSDSTPAVSPGEKSGEAVAVQSSEKTTEKKAPQASTSTDTSFNSMGELRKKQPKFYRMLLEGQFVSFMRTQERSKERIKKLRREYERR